MQTDLRIQVGETARARGTRAQVRTPHECAGLTRWLSSGWTILLRTQQVNAAHPFREGNGRTQRAFFRQLARDTGWSLRWVNVTADENASAGETSLMGDNGPLEVLLDRALEQRPSA